jgi:hypothetical protein
VRTGTPSRGRDLGRSAGRRRRTRSALNTPPGCPRRPRTSPAGSAPPRRDEQAVAAGVPPDRNRRVPTSCPIHC